MISFFAPNYFQNTIERLDVVEMIGNNGGNRNVRGDGHSQYFQFEHIVQLFFRCFITAILDVYESKVNCEYTCVDNGTYEGYIGTMYFQYLASETGGITKFFLQDTL